MKQLLIIPCSNSKINCRKNESLGNSRYFHLALEKENRKELVDARSKLEVKFDLTTNKDVSSKLEAYLRYSGNVYNKITNTVFESIKKNDSIEILIMSAYYGLIFWDERIINYNLAMNDKFGKMKISTWWRKRNLSTILAEYLNNSDYYLIRSFLSNSYLNAIKDIVKILNPNKIWLNYRYAQLGSGSNYYRGIDVARAINHYEIQCPNIKCNSFATRRISKEEYECVECNQTYKISKFNIEK